MWNSFKSLYSAYHRVCWYSKVIFIVYGNSPHSCALLYVFSVLTAFKIVWQNNNSWKSTLWLCSGTFNHVNMVFITTGRKLSIFKMDHCRTEKKETSVLLPRQKKATDWHKVYLYNKIVEVLTSIQKAYIEKYWFLRPQGKLDITLRA